VTRPVRQPERDTHNVDVGDDPLRLGREPRGAPHAVSARVPCVRTAAYRVTSDDGGRVVILLFCSFTILLFYHLKIKFYYFAILLYSEFLFLLFYYLKINRGEIGDVYFRGKNRIIGITDLFQRGKYLFQSEK